MSGFGHIGGPRKGQPPSRLTAEWRVSVLGLETALDVVLEPPLPTHCDEDLKPLRTAEQRVYATRGRTPSTSALPTAFSCWAAPAPRSRGA